MTKENNPYEDILGNENLDETFRTLFNTMFPGLNRAETKGTQRHKLRGDDVLLEQMAIGNVSAVRIVFPMKQVTGAYEGTQNYEFKYYSPSGKNWRKVKISYLSNRCRIELI